MHHWIQTLLLLSLLQLSHGQYYQSGYGPDPQPYGSQGYDFYNPAAGYDGGYFSPNGYGNYGYSSLLQTRSADDPASDAAIKNAMAPLNNIMSSVPAQPLPVPPIIALLDSQQLRSTTTEGKVQQKKSNCTTGCSAATRAAAESKSGQMNQQQTLSQSSQQITQQSTQQSAGQSTVLHGGTQMCQCPCTQGYTPPYTYPSYYMPPGYSSSQYQKSMPPYYSVAQRTRQPYRTQYRPYSYYDPNYQRYYYASIRH